MSRMRPAEGASALLTHSCPERSARTQPGTPRHVTAPGERVSGNWPGPEDLGEQGCAVAPAGGDATGLGHVTWVQRPAHGLAPRPGLHTYPPTGVEAGHRLAPSRHRAAADLGHEAQSSRSRFR